MLDVFDAKEGDRVIRLPDGRPGTFVEESWVTVYLPCGCCSETEVRAIVRWDDDPEDTDEVLPDELRLLKERGDV